MSENLSSKLENKRKNIPQDSGLGLPSSYNDTKIAILPKDPVTVFSYWEFPQELRSNLGKKYGSNFDADSLAVRVYDVTGIKFNGKNANRYFDVLVNSKAQSWYINVGVVNRAWCADLGYILKNGEFVFITRSNVLEMPRHGISDVTDEKWALIQSEFEKLLAVPDGVDANSLGVVKIMRRRREEIMNISSSTNIKNPTGKKDPKGPRRK